MKENGILLPTEVSALAQKLAAEECVLVGSQGDEYQFTEDGLGLHLRRLNFDRASFHVDHLQRQGDVLMIYVIIDKKPYAFQFKQKTKQIYFPVWKDANYVRNKTRNDCPAPP